MNATLTTAQLRNIIDACEAAINLDWDADDERAAAAREATRPMLETGRYAVETFEGALSAARAEFDALEDCMYAVLTADAIYGVGDTAEAAIEDARTEWGENRNGRMPTPGSSYAADGGLYVVPCAADLAAAVRANGGQVAFVVAGRGAQARAVLGLEVQ